MWRHFILPPCTAPWMEEGAAGKKLLLRMAGVEGHVKGGGQAWTGLTSSRAMVCYHAKKQQRGARP